MNFLKIKYLPVTIVIGFNLLTLFIFSSAPIRWASDILLLFLTFSFACQLMIMMGPSCYILDAKHEFENRD